MVMGEGKQGLTAEVSPLEFSPVEVVAEGCAAKPAWQAQTQVSVVPEP